MNNEGLYRALDPDQREIRLLVLEPGAPDEPITCSLRQAFLGSPSLPAYESVSYCWGDAQLKTRVRLNGAEFEAPRNSAAALRRLRHVSNQRILWLDALCINQNNASERGHQVADMHSIYRNATRNLIWLGDDDLNLPQAFEALDSVLNAANLETNGFKSFTSVIYGESGNIQASTSGFLVDIDPQPLLNIYNKPWFQRLWVVQEAALARSNVCFSGAYEFSLTNLVHAAVFLYFKRNFLEFDVRSNRGLYNAVTIGELALSEPTLPQNDVRLPVLLRKLQRFDTHDSRDHIYGVLGLYRHHFETSHLSVLIEPDYNKSTIGALRDAARFCIASSPRLEVLNKVSHWIHDLSDSPWPSWVPRWDRKWHPGNDSSGLLGHFTTNAGTEAQVLDVRDGQQDVLSLKGILLGDTGGCCVTAIGPAYKNIDKPGAFIDNAFRLFRSHSALSGHYDDSHAALITTLLGDRNLESQPVSKDDIEEFFAFNKQRTEKNTVPPSYRALNTSSNESLKQDEQILKASRFLTAFRRACKLRRFFVTASGHIGIGPSVLKAGDQVAILYGGYTPFILRPTDSGYRLVGECYVHGIMHGEAVLLAHHAAKENDTVFDIQ